MSRKLVQGPNREVFNKRVENVNFTNNEGLKTEKFQG